MTIRGDVYGGERNEVRKVDGNVVSCEGRLVVSWRFLEKCLNHGSV